MVAPEHREAIVKIMFTLFHVTMLLLVYRMQKKVRRNDTSFFTDPLLMVAILGLFFLVFNQLGPIFTQTISSQKGHLGDSAKGNNLLIKAGEFIISPNRTNIQVGEKLTLSLDNNSQIAHDLEIINLTVEENEGMTPLMITVRGRNKCLLCSC